MTELLESLWSWFKDAWPLALLVVTWLGIGLAWLRRKHDRDRQLYTQQVNFSLNYVEDGVLRLRTLLEDSAERVWLNAHTIALVRKAAERTTKEQPFLRLNSAAEMEAVKHAVINVLSERFAPVFVAKALGAPVRTDRFVFGVTWERFGAQRLQKLRVIIVREDDIEGIATIKPPPKVALKHHRDRLTTLRVMWNLLAARSERTRRLVGVVELGVAADVPALPHERPVVLDAALLAAMDSIVTSGADGDRALPMAPPPAAFGAPESSTAFAPEPASEVEPAFDLDAPSEGAAESHDQGDAEAKTERA